jgi:serralysin
MPLSANEQYLLELINRGRLDPMAEAARYGIDLNASLAAGTISGAAKQVLAPNALLETAAIGHSSWMLAKNIFSHTGENGSTLGTRATAAGYQWSTVGENIAVWGTSGTLNLTSAIDSHHRGLFLSAGHRTNLMHNTFTEIGLAQESGRFAFSGGTPTNASMLTELFGHKSGSKFLTGVVYSDTDVNSFYTVGEGRAGTTFEVAGQITQSEAAGGYSLSIGQMAAGVVMGVANNMFYSAVLDFSGGNAKLDIVNGNTYFTSAPIVLASGINNVTQLGIANLSVIGNESGNFIIGNAGNNELIGYGGNDVIYAYAGNDGLRGGNGHDHFLGGNGNDILVGEAGLDYLHGEAGRDWMIGGTGADWFAFANTDGTDIIEDFSLAENDRLRLRGDLWTGTLTTDQIVSRFASVTAAGVVFNFGDGDTLTLLGVTSTAGLADAVLIW